VNITLGADGSNGACLPGRLPSLGPPCTVELLNNHGDRGEVRTQPDGGGVTAGPDGGGGFLRARFSVGPRGLVLAAALLFGTTGTARALGPDISPLGAGAARIAVGAALLATVAILLDRRAARADRPDHPAAADRSHAAGLPARPWPRLAVALGGLGVAAYQLAFFAAVADTGVAVGTVVALGSAPVFAGLLSRIVHRQTLDARWAACTALATAGVATLVAAGSDTGNIAPKGVALALVAGIGYAAYTVAAKHMLDQGHRPEQVMARTFGTGAIVLLPIIPATGALSTAPAVAEALYLGAIPTALAYVLFARGLKRLPTHEVATLTLAEPVTAAALGTVVLGERLTVTAALGAAMVLAGLAALALPRHPPGQVVQDPAPT
jgi:DME family drug/metabolite transporter